MTGHTGERRTERRQQSRATDTQADRPQRLPTLLQSWKSPLRMTDNDPTGALTRAYILALGLIAILTLSGHIITTRIVEQQKESTSVAYQIGRQRALTQQIVLYAMNYNRMNDRLDYDFMMQSLWDLNKGHDFMVKTIMEEGSSPSLTKIYFSQPFNLDKRIRDFSALIDKFSTYPPPPETGANAKDVKERQTERKNILDKASFAATNTLRPAMDSALESYQTETIGKIAHAYSIQISEALFILVVLAAEALFIFRPLIGKIKSYHTKLHRYALEDSLTGLDNRRAFMNNAASELKKAKQGQTAVTTALIDLDHFKTINDTYGHDVGDRVLQHFAEILGSSIRSSDFTGRIGGEEFAVLLPGIDRAGAAHILQRLCEKVAKTPCSYRNADNSESQLHYTCSIGFTGPALLEDETIDDLLSRADGALYDSKTQGRNRVSHRD